MATAFEDRVAQLQALYHLNEPLTTSAAVSDVITATGHDYSDGDVIQFATDTTLPAPLVAGTNYYARDVSGGTFKVSATRGGAAIDITDTGTGNHTSQKVDAVANTTHAGVSLIKEGYVRYAPFERDSVVATEKGKKLLTKFADAGYLT